MLDHDKLIRKLSSRAEIEVTALPEEEPIEGNASAWDEETDDRVNREIRDQLDRGNEWAWCSIRVRASFGGFSGEDYLGCCSYASEADFRQPGGCFDDMKAEAIGRLADEIIRADAAIRTLG